jgi:hypothetical protein
MIYFVKNTMTGSIKIGFANSEIACESRFESLQTGNEFRLKLIKVIGGTMSDEKELHRRFGAFRIRGEWFYPDSSLLNYIETRRQRRAKRRTTPRLSDLLDECEVSKRFQMSPAEVRRECSAAAVMHRGAVWYDVTKLNQWLDSLTVHPIPHA